MSHRLEPSPRSAELDEGLAARVHDPLWFLARQWQLGEFAAKDAGTPALINVTGAAAPVTAWRGVAQPDWQPYDPLAIPLDAVVEPESQPSPNLRLRIEAGTHFLRLLAEAGLAHYGPAFTAAAPFDASMRQGDLSTDPLLAAVAARVPDGLALTALAQPLAGGQPSSVTIDAGDVAAVAAIAAGWLEWFTGESGPTAGGGAAVTWQEHRLEYGFAVACPARQDGAGGTVLTAPAYRGDGLDWFDFDVDSEATAPADQAAPFPIDLKAVPTPLRYGGMPAPRFWQMEDAKIDFGSVDASGLDIGRLLVVEFATVYGNDWYLLPVKLPTGTLTSLTQVVVLDVFGRAFELQPADADDPQWNLFSIAGSFGSGVGLFLPPTATSIAESDPLESVLFLRDDMADLAWAIERRIEDPLGNVVDRRSVWMSSRPPQSTVPVTAPPAYRVETTVPEYWIPLAPEQLPDHKSIRLRLVPMAADQGSTIEPKGSILQAHDSDGRRLWLYDEEVPEEGTSVERIRRYTRWQNGQIAAWTVRRRQIGVGEGSSGLRFDILDPS